MQYDVYFEICEWNIYFYQSVVQHTGYSAAKGVHYSFVLLSVIPKE